MGADIIKAKYQYFNFIEALCYYGLKLGCEKGIISHFKFTGKHICVFDYDWSFCLVSEHISLPNLSPVIL